MKFLDEYKQKLGKWYYHHEPHSISAWEMFFFYRFACQHDVCRIVESGTYRGFSAHRLALLFPDAKIISLDKRRRHMKIARSRFSIPDYRTGELKDNLGLVSPSTAVLIDGPKGIESVELAKRAYDCGALFVAVHDAYDIVDDLVRCFDTVIHSGNPVESEIEIDRSIGCVPKNYNNYYGAPLAICSMEVHP